MTHADSVSHLADFIESDDLDRLEAWSRQFNVFEAMGAVRSELRHSNALAWLLDPSESHGFGAAFLALFLRHAARSARESEDVEGDAIPSPFDVNGWDLSGAEVRREWRNIDLLIVDRANGFVCAIENKVFSGEHSGQLPRYRGIVDAAFPEAEHRLFVFLSPGAVTPSDPHYVALSYDDISFLLGRLEDRNGSSMSEEVRLFTSHYRTMIDRNLSQESEIETICREIYRTHRHALDLIIAHLPDLYSETHEQLVQLIADDDDLILDRSNKTYTRFMPKSLDGIVPREPGGAFDKGRVVVFEIENRQEKPLQIKLEMIPCRAELRRPLLEVAQRRSDLFTSARPSDNGGWKKLWGVNLNQATRHPDADERNVALKEAVEDFKQAWLPQFAEAIQEAYGDLDLSTPTDG